MVLNFMYDPQLRGLTELNKSVLSTTYCVFTCVRVLWVHFTTGKALIETKGPLHNYG